MRAAVAVSEVPKRGEYCRVIAAEFNRIASHLLSVGTMGMDIGAMTPFTHAIREREMINDLIEELSWRALTSQLDAHRVSAAWDLSSLMARMALLAYSWIISIPSWKNTTSLISFNKIYIERLR